MLQRLERLWRIVATGICFTVFGIGGVLLRLTVFPLVRLLWRAGERRAAVTKLIVSHTLAAFVLFMRFMGVMTYSIKGQEKLHRQGLLILANHPTLIDVVFLISLVSRPDCVVKASLAHNPFTRGPVRSAGFVCNDAGAEALIDCCIASVRAGNHLIIFPEGTRTPVDGAVKLQRGAANVAVRGRIDVTPVTIQCSTPFLTKGTPWYRVPPQRPHFEIEVQDDMPIQTFIEASDGEALAARRLTHHLSEYFFPETARASA